MDQLPFQKLVEILDSPVPVDDRTMSLMSWWMRPKTVSSNRVLEALVAAELAVTNSEGRRLIQQGGVVWNGQKITDVDEPLTFIEGQWGVFKIGKRHRMIKYGLE